MVLFDPLEVFLTQFLKNMLEIKKAYTILLNYDTVCNKKKTITSKTILKTTLCLNFDEDFVCSIIFNIQKKLSLKSSVSTKKLKKSLLVQNTKLGSPER